MLPGRSLLNYQNIILTRCRWRTSDCAGFLHVQRLIFPFSSLSFSPVPALDPNDQNQSKFISSSTSLPRVQQVARHFSSQLSSRFKMTSSNGYAVRKNGAANTLEHRVYIEKDGVPISPFHDIPLYANDQQTVLNMIVEIPRWTNAKLEVCYLSLAPSRSFGMTFEAVKMFSFCLRQ